MQSGAHLFGALFLFGSLGFAQSYEPHVIGSLSDPDEVTFTRDINNDGVVVGFHFKYLVEQSTAFLDRGAGPVPLPLPPGTLNSQANAINDHGVIAGTLEDASGVHAFTWDAGVTTLLSSPMGDPRVSAINNSGIVVGHVYGNYPYTPVAWVGGQQIALPVQLGVSKMAVAVNDLGRVLIVEFGSSPRATCVHDLVTGNSTDLPNPTGTLLEGRAIHDDGTVVGQRRVAGVTSAFRWTEAGGFDSLTFPGATSGEAWDINQASHVTGTARSSSSITAALWIGVESIDLGPLAGSGFQVYQAFQSNDRGEIIASAVVGPGPDVVMVKLSPRAETTSYCMVAPNSTGSTALMDSEGSASVSLDTLRLTAEPVPAGTFGLFVFAQNPAQVPFGSGFLCVSLPFQRLPLEMADGTGTLAHDLELSSGPASAIDAGTTWYFQAWFRDNTATPPFNTSDGLAVGFTL